MQVFENEKFGKVRVIEIDGQPWWVLKDVCKALGLNSPHKVAERLDEDERNQIPLIDNIGRNQKTAVITESGLYAVILRSDKPNAKAFRRWITSDILPSIRKHGAYIADETLRKMRDDSSFTNGLIKRLFDEQTQNNNLLEHIDKLAPKARYCDIILQCDSAIPISVIAKDYGMTAVMFNKLLHSLKVQYRSGGTWLLYNEHVGKGYAVSKTYYIRDRVSAIHTYWTQKGRKFIYELLKWRGILPQIEQTQNMGV